MIKNNMNEEIWPFFHKWIAKVLFDPSSFNLLFYYPCSFRLLHFNFKFYFCHILVPGRRERRKLLENLWEKSSQVIKLCLTIILILVSKDLSWKIKFNGCDFHFQWLWEKNRIRLEKFSQFNFEILGILEGILGLFEGLLSFLLWFLCSFRWN